MEEWEYNTKNGIKESILTLDAFHKMLDARRAAYYENKQALNSFIVLGKWYLDMCGNCGTALEEFIPAEHLDIASVATRDELFELIRQYDVAKNPDVLTSEEIKADDFDFSANTRPYPTSMSYGMGWAEIPEARSLCPYCRCGWTMDNVADAVRREQPSECIYLIDFVGKPFSEVRKHYREQRLAYYIIRNESQVRNDKHIDLTPLEGYDTLKVNQRGWITVDDDYIVEPDDELSAHVYHYYHQTCLIKQTEDKCAEYLENNGEGYSMRNLAGRMENNAYINLELSLAGIHRAQEKGRGEVQYKFAGYLGDACEFKFTRAWSYWVVDGNVPLDIANELYADPEAKKYVRSGGDCGCRSPETWATWITIDLKEVFDKGELDKIESDNIKESLLNNPNLKFVEGDPSKIAQKYVTCYHIDTWEGLKLFADKIKEFLGGAGSPRADINKRLSNIER
jgi:hypothetical protein